MWNSLKEVSPEETLNSRFPKVEASKANDIIKPGTRKIIRLGRHAVIQGSSEMMPEIPSNSIDVIVTSPPYNVGKQYDPDGKFTDKLPLKEYLEFLGRVFLELNRVLNPKGLFFLNIGDSARDQGKSEAVAKQAVKAGFIRIQTAIWVKSLFGKGHYTPSGKSKRLNNVWEHIFIFAKTKNYEIDPRRIGIPYADKSNIGRYAKEDLRDPGDVWFVPYQITTGQTIKKGHEAPFPIGLPYLCIRLVPTAKYVLDPFLGTGSTLSAAEKLGLVGIGYELYPNIEVIKKRIFETQLENPQFPLVTQLERIKNTGMTLLLKLLENVAPNEKNELWKSIPQIERKHFLWALKDLELLELFIEQLPLSEKEKAMAEKLLQL